MITNTHTNDNRKVAGPTTSAAIKLADELEQLGDHGIKDSKLIQKIAEKLVDVITRPDRDVGH